MGSEMCIRDSYIIGRICDHDCVSGEVAVYGRGEGCAGVFFGFGGCVGGAGEREGCVRDVLDSETSYAGVGGGEDFLGEVLGELMAAVGFAGFGEAGYED